MKRLFALALAVGAVVAPVAASTASAAPSTYAQVVSVKWLSPDTANVRAIYRCTGEPTLWVSVKQKGDAKADPALTGEGSSMLAINSGGVWIDTHRVLPNCDGKVHTQNFLVDKVEVGGIPGNGSLKKGWAYVQFCLFDDNYPLPAEGTPEDQGAPYSQMVFRYVS